MTDRERKRKAYRTNPEYRERQIARVRSRHQQRVSDPTYKRLVHVRKTIVQVRDSIDSFLLKTAKRERDLIRLINERDALVDELLLKP